MFRRFAIFSLAVFVIPLFSAPPDYSQWHEHIVPQPVSYTSLNETVAIACRPIVQCISSTTCSDLVKRRLDIARDEYWQYLPESCSVPSKQMLVEVIINTESSHWPSLEMDESYSISSYPPTQSVRVVAGSFWGARHAFATLSQMTWPLLRADGHIHEAEFHFAMVSDRPRYPWRGIQLDTARHWHPVALIKREIRAMAAAKLNTLHLHLTDSESFPVELGDLAFIARKAGYKTGQKTFTYTEADLRDIVEYAADRGVRVVPEFDLPGHSHALGIGSSGSGLRSGTWDVNMTPVNIASQYTRAIITNLIRLMTHVFPDQVFHLGGDEVSESVYRQHQEQVSFMERLGISNTHDYVRWFFTEIQPAVLEMPAYETDPAASRCAGGAALMPSAMSVCAGRLAAERPGVLSGLTNRTRARCFWEEASLVNRVTLSGDVIEVWRSEGTVARIQTTPGAGGAVLAAPFYLDKQTPCMRSAYYWLDNAHAMYDYEPENFEAKGDVAPLLGFDAPMWAEGVTARTSLSRIWSRAAVVGERWWSQAADANARSQKGLDGVFRSEFALHFDTFGCRLSQLGVAWTPLRGMAPCPMAVDWAREDEMQARWDKELGTEFPTSARI